MRIGVVLRHFEEHRGGVFTYTVNLLEQLLALHAEHDFVLFYAKPDRCGRFAGRPHVEEVVVQAPSKLLWDQVALPRAARRARLDVLFNTKYSLPLVSGIPGVFVCHGLDWYLMPAGSRWFDRLNHQLLIPRYARSAAAVIAVAETVRREAIERFRLAPGRVFTVHHGLDERFRREPRSEEITALRARLGLPERFFLYVGQIYPPKNVLRLLEAYAKVGPARGIELVVAGEHRWLAEDAMARMRAPDLAPWVRQIGWVEQADLPALYRAAEALTLPSLYEGFGLPILEAMAIGCPVLTSDRYAMAEVAGGCALLVDPESIQSIAGGLARLADDSALRAELARRGSAHAATFSWARCARETLEVLETVVAARVGAPAGNDQPVVGAAG